MNVFEKLMFVQRKLKVPKSQYNSFGKYFYRSCEDIQEGLKPLLSEIKAVIVISDSIENIGNRFYLKATVKFIDIESGEIIENTALAREEENKKGMDGSQVTGTSSSYARKYALNGMFCIDDTKDCDTDENKEEKSARTQKSKEELIKEFEQELDRTGKQEKWFLEKFKVNSTNDLTENALKQSINALKSYMDKN